MLPGGLELGSIFEDLPPINPVFNLTVGAFSGGFAYLYGFLRDDSYGGGSLSPDEPVYEAPVYLFAHVVAGGATPYSGRIELDGNVVSELTGKTVWIDGVEYTAGFSGWSYGTSSYDGLPGAPANVTLATWSQSSSPRLPFQEFSTYLIEIKDAS